MKKIIFLFLFALSFYALNAQIQQADFNVSSVPSGWSATSSGGTCSWQFGYTGNMPGSGLITPANFDNGAALFSVENCAIGVSATAELEGPEVDLNALSVTGAQIEVIFNLQTFFNNGIFTISVWDGTSWQNVYSVSADTPAENSGVHQTEIIDVSPHINSAFKVRFSYDNEAAANTFGVGIDDYKLINTATAGIDELLSVGFGYYPNPLINSDLNLRADEPINSVEVYNMLGQKIIARKPNTEKLALQMQNYPTGAYIVNVEIGNKKGNFKVLKQ